MDGSGDCEIVCAIVGEKESCQPTHIAFSTRSHRKPFKHVSEKSTKEKRH
jgi:hypothetical protein